MHAQNRQESLTLTAFLLARIAEDEEMARTAAPHFPSEVAIVSEVWEDVVAHIAHQSPARVLAECEAKRRIVEAHQEWPVLIQTEPTMEPVGDELATMTFRMTQQIQWATNREYVARFGTEPPTTPFLLALAAVYADHPDYDEAWRP